MYNLPPNSPAKRKVYRRAAIKVICQSYGLKERFLEELPPYHFIILGKANSGGKASEKNCKLLKSIIEKKLSYNLRVSRG